MKTMTKRKRKVVKRKSFFDMVEENHKNDNTKKLFQLSQRPVPVIHSKKKAVKQPTKGKWDNRKVTNKLRFKHPFRDNDNDNVPNYRDCQPYDKSRHGVEPTELMRERMEGLPIYVTDEAVPHDPNIEALAIEDRIFNFRSPEARSHAPRARKMMLSMIKRYPDLITEMKRKRPRIILVTSQPDPEGEYAGAAYPDYRKRGVVIIYGLSEKQRSEIKESGITADMKRPIPAYEGSVLRHELEHIKQFREDRTGKVSAYKIRKGEYEERPSERMARKAQKRLHEKHSKERPEEETLEFVRREFDDDYERDYDENED